MTASTAELTLILKAQNLADVELGKIRAGLEKITTTAQVVADDVAAAFKRIGSKIARQFGNVAQDILSGSSLEASLAAVGITAAGAMVEGLMEHLIPTLGARLAASSTFGPAIAAMTAGGTTLGSVLTGAIALGIAALPFVLAAAAVAALVYLATNPEARQKARAVALMILGKIGDGLRALPGAIAGFFTTAWTTVTTAIPGIITSIVDMFLGIPGKLIGMGAAIVKTIINAMVGLPGKIAEKIRQAFRNMLPINIGPFHITMSGVSIDLPDINTPGRGFDRAQPGGGYAHGGWAGLNGPEIAMLGERGPEYVIPNHRLGSMGGGGGGGFRIQGVSERDIIEMVDRGLYFKLQRAAPTLDRS